MNTKEQMFIRSFEATSSDENKWRLLRLSGTINYTVILDNDWTIVVICDGDEWSWVGRFNDSIGNSLGVDSLLTSLGIKWERC